MKKNPTCGVLDCSEEATRVWILTSAVDNLIETTACMDHSAAIDEGAPWDWDSHLLIGDQIPQGRTPRSERYIASSHLY